VNDGPSGDELLRALDSLGGWPEKGIDHINGNGADNSWSNLRAANQHQNIANGRMWSHNTSGFKGASYRRDIQKWRASIQVRGRPIHLGNFKTPQEAHAAYRKAAERYFGEFARAE
jgi:hypothetical protein